jgi:hypothetical protein
MHLLLASGHAPEVLAVYQKHMPALFAQPTPRLYPGQATDAMQAGIALLRSGATPQGRDLLTAAIGAVAQRPYAAAVAGRGWLDVVAHAQLGEPDQAFAALQEGVDSGYVLGLPALDRDPLLAQLRTDPRYQKILAPARIKAAAQVNAARAAGLL